MRTQFGVSEVSHHMAQGMKDIILYSAFNKGMRVSLETYEYLHKVIRLTIKTKGKILSLLPHFYYYNNTTIYR